jgi:serine/threonine-protein kinase
VIDIGSVLNERFLLQKELGRGGMGAVYSATDQLLERSVAIKLLKEQSGEEVGRRLRLEAQIAARLLHENVVRIYDFGIADGTYYLVMEEVRGSSYSKRWRHLPLEKRMAVLAQVADALDYAHHQGVIHRDVKPANVLMTEGDAPKLSDFGLSMIAESADQTGVIRGTPHYMSPEQTKGGRLDFRTDLYSLGVMLYESATGVLPYTGVPLAIMSQHANATPEKPRVRKDSISENLESLILWMMAKRPESRPASGALVAEALRREIERMSGKSTYVGDETTILGSSKATGLARPPVSSQTEPATLANGSQLKLSTPTDKATSFQTVTDPASISSSPVSHASDPGPRSSGSGNSTGKSASSFTGNSSLASPSAIIAGTGGALGLVQSPLVRKMLQVVLAEPILLSAEERYLSGHYLAYLLSGSQRRGLFLRRPLDPRNADRARLLLALTYATLLEGSEEGVKDAAELLDKRVDVRPVLSPVVVLKYLASRGNLSARKLFRRTRKAVCELTTYGQKKMLDSKGLLNPGLMPQRLEDLQLISPARTEVDDVLVERWNRVAQVWRDEPEFRLAVLRYATNRAERDPASVALWPEVVYPLIERSRWHRRIRPKAEAIWDYVCAKILHVPDAGVVLDRALHRSVPASFVAQLDHSLDMFEDQAFIQVQDIEGHDPFAKPNPEERIVGALAGGSHLSIDELALEPVAPDNNLMPLVDPNPLRFTQGELYDLLKEALAGAQASMKPGAKLAGHRPVPIGPYRLSVVVSVRGRAAGQVSISGMGNKQVELSTPTFRTRSSPSKPLIAVWIYRDNSLVVTHLDFMGAERYVLWHAPPAHELKFDNPADLNHELYTLGMEIPDQLDRVLTRKFKPIK